MNDGVIFTLKLWTKQFYASPCAKRTSGEMDFANAPKFWTSSNAHHPQINSLGKALGGGCNRAFELLNKNEFRPRN